MIASYYNYYVENRGKVIYLNGVSGKTFSVKADEHSFLVELMKDTNLQCQHKELTQWLNKYRFLVSSHADELDYLLEISKSKRENDDYHLIINPTLQCNFNCWYCYEKHPIGHMNAETINQIKLHITNKIEHKHHNAFNLSWFGGEPLLCFNNIIYPISTLSKDLCGNSNIPFCNSITTNGYLINEDMIKQFLQIDLRHFQITLDGDKQTHDQIRNQKGKPSFDRIIKNCISMIRQMPEVEIKLRINYTNESILIPYWHALDIIPKEYRRNIIVQFQRVWQTYHKSNNELPIKDYLEKNKLGLQEAGFEVSIDPCFSIFKGIVCYADRKNYANINYDGKIYRCTARDYTSEDALGELSSTGEIIWYNERLHNIDSNAYFANSKCLSCKRLPLCGGPCFRKKMDTIISNRDFCSMDYLDTEFDDFVVENYTKTIKQNATLTQSITI